MHLSNWPPIFFGLEIDDYTKAELADIAWNLAVRIDGIEQAARIFADEAQVTRRYRAEERKRVK